MAEADLGHALKLAPADAAAYLRGKGFAFSWDWHDTLREAHDRAFVVAKMAEERLLEQTRGIVVRMMDEGRTIGAAAEELEEALRAAGWWGEGAAEGAAVQLGSPRRVRTILRTNLATAYAAGRYKRMDETRAARPYWQYVAVRDGRTRPSHAALDGKVWASDSPVWDTLYPPNGFNCRCRVRALTARRVERLGLEAGTEERIEDHMVAAGRDSITGQAVEIPAKRAVWTEPGGAERSFEPDPGWSYNPGREAFGGR